MSWWQRQRGCRRVRHDQDSRREACEVDFLRRGNHRPPYSASGPVSSALLLALSKMQIERSEPQLAVTVTTAAP